MAVPHCIQRTTQKHSELINLAGIIKLMSNYISIELKENS